MRTIPMPAVALMIPLAFLIGCADNGMRQEPASTVSALSPDDTSRAAGKPARGSGQQRAQAEPENKGNEASTGKVQQGEASWYGEQFEGKKTASGEKFDPDKLTAAHPTLPLGSEAEVTNLETGKSVTVEINDRGPYTDGREIDLSKAAAEKIDMVEDGEAKVRIEPQR